MDTTQTMEFWKEKAENLEKINYGLQTEKINLKSIIEYLNQENNELSEFNTSLNFTYNQMVYEHLDKMKN